MTSIVRTAVLRPIYELFEQGTLTGLTDEQLVERFAARRDETAFEALIVRHGRSVLAVCHDVLRDGHDAEDAFQATFLILARKAGSLWVRGSLAAWLHRVARRVSVEASERKARRRRFEKTGLKIDAAEPIACDPLLGLMKILHEEIDRLPEKYRAPIILCELEALTRDQAAHRLGWQPGTVAGRLARARSILRERIGRRGDVNGVDLAQATAQRRATAREVPWALIAKTASSAAAATKNGVASVGGAELARRVTAAIIVTRLKYGVATSIAAGFVAVVVVAGLRDARPESKPQTTASIGSERIQTPSRGGPADGADAMVPIAGTVVLQDGRPARGARVFFSLVDHAFDDGTVRADTFTGDGGQFNMPIPHVDVPWAGFLDTGALWVYRPGSLVASMPVYRGALPPGLPERFVLAPRTRVEFEVVGPDGKAVTDARIEPSTIDRDHAHVPDRLASIIAAETVTNARGRAVMTAFFSEELTAIRVTANGFGRQDFRFVPGKLDAGVKVVKLRPVGRLKGRLVGDPATVRHRPLRVISFGPPGERSGQAPNRTISTDENGGFDIPEIVAGPIAVRTVPRSDLAWFAHSDGSLNVEAGKTTEVVLTLKPAVRVRGVVREQGTEKPIAGVRLDVTLEGSDFMKSGDDGSYEGYMPPGVAFVLARFIPPRYARPLFGPVQVRVPEDAVDFALPPFELTPAGELAGLIVDDRARPVAGAQVEATWVLNERGPGTGLHHLSVRSGPDGRFNFQGIPIGADVSLSAHHRGLRTIEPTRTRPGEAKVLHLMPSHCVAMVGRVLDKTGRPIVGANVHLRARRPTPIDPTGPEGLVGFEGGFVLVTDLEGRFHTPKELEPGREYVAYASADGYQNNRTRLTTGESGSFPELTLEAAPASP
jgi:RNA polymerase sigma factor (sigma-70 family)